MLTRLDLRASRPDRAALDGLLPRAAVDMAARTGFIPSIMTSTVTEREEAQV